LRLNLREPLHLRYALWEIPKRRVNLPLVKIKVFKLPVR